MRRSVCFLAAWFFLGGYDPEWPQDKTPPSPKKVPDGVHAVLREGLKEKKVLPLKGEHAEYRIRARSTLLERATPDWGALAHSNQYG